MERRAKVELFEEIRREYHWKARCKIILIARHEHHAPAAFDSQRAVAVEFDFVFPTRTFWMSCNRKALHRFDESSRLFCTALSG